MWNTSRIKKRAPFVIGKEVAGSSETSIPSPLTARPAKEAKMFPVQQGTSLAIKKQMIPVQQTFEISYEPSFGKESNWHPT